MFLNKKSTHSGATFRFPIEEFEGLGRKYNKKVILLRLPLVFGYFLSSVLPVSTLNTHRLNVIPVKMEGKSLNYTVLIGQDEDGIYIAKVPDIPGCYTQGKTVEQAMERIREAIQVCLEA